MRTQLALATAAMLTSSLAQAHFQLLYTPEVMLEKPGTLDFKLVFGHPMENGHTMDMGKPEDFYVVFKGEQTDLTDSLQPITWKGAHNEAQAYEASYKVRRNGDYAFVLVPAPYYEKSEDIYIQQITKALINKGGMPTDWHEPLGLKTEIVPLNKPYQVYAGGSFTGRLLRNGEPAAGVECEIEYINTTIDMNANAFAADALGDVPPSAIVTITDADGEFTFGIPGPGVWGFACLGSGPDTEYDGKELSQDAVLWINASPLDTTGAPATAAHASTHMEEPDTANTQPLTQDQVRELQQALATIGLYQGSTDGVPGPGTTKAVELFQRAHGIDGTGEATSALLANIVQIAKQL
ncbi:DUF4198 domain-containing protein [Rhabdochromatium marinum]|uniref:DUF4198 domain-containing protein n=1 Tax=Rhabdochromatium marinum TaxID=48729 RepID=UPI0019044773|nr:DUF4198 domain-containing protein [Rhabdochromatium marinum]MBK1647193.1 nickel transporter [Rhabdochromatium marinum]